MVKIEKALNIEQSSEQAQQLINLLYLIKANYPRV